ncbi:MAG: aminotransferase class I/II-fold pyridoxal phosphate-dependent enzyme [DPANN group archaeon]|nr:aminotransferase class I/II-fold pyridoxal phosphate-dependent enzyme [DPANN group archaeon]
MTKANFYRTLQAEIDRIDNAKTAKRHERIIEGFRKEEGRAPKGIVQGKSYMIFNSNDYLGLRHHPKVKAGEQEASEKYGAGPGAVRFISGTLKVHVDLEKEIARFHDAEAAMVFSSSFAANMAVIHCFIKGQSRDSVVENNTLVVSDALNHRSIIDGIRVAGLPKENKAIFKHLDYDDLKRVLEEHKGKFKRVLVITDGVFSMLGEYADLAEMKKVCDSYDDAYEEGVITIVDDAHGIAAMGDRGRGCQDVTGVLPDLLVATMGKGIGSDGGYVTGRQVMIDYLRESAATYIYSNSIAPGTAGAALVSFRMLQEEEGKALLAKLKDNITYFRKKAKDAGFRFAVDSIHGIQPVLIGDPVKTNELTRALFDDGIIATQISYPVVPKGKDEIRIQISAAHTQKDLDECVEKMTAAGKKVGLLS